MPMAMMDQLIGLVSPTAALRRAKHMREHGQGAEAFPLVARAARAGFADAEFWVAQSYLEGSGVPASRPEGVRWLKRAAAMAVSTPKRCSAHFICKASLAK